MMRRLLRDPLAHFLVAGAAIWVALSLAGEPVDPAERTIALTREEQANLALGFERTMGRPPTDAELDAQIESWVREEVLYREALRLGLDAGDPVVRRRLSTKMDDLAGAEVETARPSEETLAAWLREHPGRFAEGERFTFSQTYFRSKDALRDALGGAGDASGDAISLPERMTDASYDEIMAVFGSQFAAQIAGMQETSGAQLRSGYGFHLVDVEERVEGRQPPLSEIRDKVEADWRSSTAAARRARAFELLREAYRIEVE